MSVPQYFESGEEWLGLDPVPVPRESVNNTTKTSELIENALTSSKVGSPEAQEEANSTELNCLSPSDVKKERYGDPVSARFMRDGSLCVVCSFRN